VRNLGIPSRDAPAARARLSIEELADHFGTDPAIATALSELAGRHYIEHPDAHTIELTARGFDAAQRTSAS
jgi:hypothetical protein